MEDLLSVVKGQRDRFRARMMELEAGRDQAVKDLEDHKAKADRLLADNVLLYEKIK